MTSDYEGMPNALAEAMAIGLPSISTDCKTGPRDLIDDGKNGFLIPVGDAKALADRIEKVFSMTEQEKRELGENAREKIIKYCSEENSLKQLINLIESL
jgi:glycosyltransferase involved in cell wall biosynthesis